MGRSKDSCWIRANFLGVKYNNISFWTKDEENFLRENYVIKGSKYVASCLNRSEVACRSKAIKLGIKRSLFWSEEDKNFLIKNYPDKGAKWVALKLNKSSSACRKYAYKNGIEYINRNKWTSDELRVLKKYYPIVGKYVVELIPKKSMSACINMARKLKIVYKKKNSSLVEKIKEILEKRNIFYKQEVGFKECFDKNILLFDFALYKDSKFKEFIGLIEYDGIQHFFETTLYRDYNTPSKIVLASNQKHDKIKNNFCIRNNISMLRIKYNQDNIEELVDMFLDNSNSFKKWFNPELSYREYYNYLDNKEVDLIYKYKNKFKIKDIGMDIYIKEWTKEEDDILRKYYPDNGSLYVSKFLNRTKGACRCRANRLGLCRSSRWSKKEDVFLIKYYNDKGIEWVSRKLNRSNSAVRHRADRIGIDKISREWTKEEDNILLKYYKIKSKNEIANMLNRSFGSVSNRIRKLVNEVDIYNDWYIKVITVNEPSASLIKENIKHILVSRIKTNYRGELYIHIAKRILSKDECVIYRKQIDILKDNNFKYGYIIAKCKLVDCIYVDDEFINKIKDNDIEYLCDDYIVGRYAFILENIEELNSYIYTTGKVGIWKYIK